MTKKTNQDVRIIKIISVVDTREYEEIGYKWKPIPGSGKVSQCDRCGRDHVVHATVELSDGREAIVGTSCMKKDSMAKALRSLAAKATRLAKLQAERNQILTRIEASQRMEKEVDALTPPEVKRGKDQEIWDYARERWEMGDAYVLCRSFDEGNKQALMNNWRRKRLEELGWTYKHQFAQYDLDKVEEKIARIEK